MTIYEPPKAIALNDNEKKPMAGYITSYVEGLEETKLNFEINGPAGIKTMNEMILMLTSGFGLAAMPFFRKNPLLLYGMASLYVAANYLIRAGSYYGSETNKFSRELKTHVENTFGDGSVKIEVGRGYSVEVLDKEAGRNTLFKKIKGAIGCFTFRTEDLARNAEEFGKTKEEIALMLAEDIMLKTQEKIKGMAASRK